MPATRPVSAVALFLPWPHVFAENTGALKASVEALSDAKYKKIHSFRKRGPGAARARARASKGREEPDGIR